MSRIGKKPIAIPKGVTVVIEENLVSVKGPKGENKLDLHPKVKVAQEESLLKITVEHPEEKQERALWGLTRALLANLIAGVQEPFVKRLEMVGVGFRAQVQERKIVLEAGYSHPVELDIPEGVECAMEKNIIVIKSIDKQKVGAFAAEVRAVRKPEPYKGKGIKYEGEVIRRKAGKAAKTGAAVG